MSKIKITSKQEKFLNKLSDEGRSNDDILKMHASKNLWENDLDQLSMIELATALINGYDIRDYKEDDYVVFESHGDVKVGCITHVKNRITVRSNGYVELVHHSDIKRLATEEEALWAKLGREVNEWRSGDVIILTGGHPYLIKGNKRGEILYENLNYMKTINEAKDYYIKGEIESFYTSETSVSCKEVDTEDICLHLQDTLREVGCYINRRKVDLKNDCGNIILFSLSENNFEAEVMFKSDSVHDAIKYLVLKDLVIFDYMEFAKKIKEGRIQLLYSEDEYFQHEEKGECVKIPAGRFKEIPIFSVKDYGAVGDLLGFYHEINKTYTWFEDWEISELQEVHSEGRTTYW